MKLPPYETWTRTAQIRNAPLSRFNPVHPNASPIIWKLARHLEAITSPYGCKAGRGWDDSSTEHKTRRALDWIISTEVGVKASDEDRVWIGNLVVTWLIDHADELQIRHIIWNRRIWKRRYRGTATEWTKLSGRKGVSDWHEDHIHVYLDSFNGWVPDVPLLFEEEDLMAGITEERLALISEQAASAAIIKFIESPRYSEYLDEDRDGKTEPRSLSDILFATHAHSVSANRFAAALAKETGLDEGAIVKGLAPVIAELGNKLEAKIEALDIEGVDSKAVAKDVVAGLIEELTN